MQERAMSLSQVLPSIAVALSVTIAFMFALRPIANRVELVDRPGGRKQHSGNIPIIGGLAMFIGMMSGLSILGLDLGFLLSIYVASILLVVIGLIDDKYPLPAAARMTTQVAVVLIMIYGADLYLADIGNPFGFGLITTGPFMLIFTMLVALTMINAYNMIDGLDGLAGSLTLVALVSVAAVAGISNQAGAAALVIAASVYGFLLFNFPVAWNRPIRSFMGDAGSTLLGFTVVWVTLGVAQGEARVISPVHALWFAAVPIFDCLSCFVRRSFQGKSPFTPGCDHFHHILLRGGFGIRAILGIITGTQAIYAIIGLLGYFAGVPDYIMFAAWSVLGLSQQGIFRAVAKFHRLSRRAVVVS
jgi:UDP-GlcNAc:undecaprenyl-phosphate/decaprenyl-phosphate GlcNAc-1-phosphate transferase